MRRLLNELPNLVNQWQDTCDPVGELSRHLFRAADPADIEGLGGELGNYGQRVLEFSLASLPSVFVWLIFLVLVPILVFFMMKDKDELVMWAGNFLPRNRPLMRTIWEEMDMQLANYVRGKVVEIIIVGSVAYAIFIILDLNYALLLSVLVGLSVIVPFIGATAVTLPIAAVAYFQWGIGGDFYTVMIAYPCLAGAGRQCAGAVDFFRGGEPPPGGDYRRGAGVRGHLGHGRGVFRNSSGHVDQGHH